MRQYLIEDQMLGLTPYSEADTYAFLNCWQDEVTQRGFNFIPPKDEKGRTFGEISAFPFWVVAVEKSSGTKLGVLRLSPDVENPDLAIWIYPAHRGKGWGGRAYRLALQYLFSHGYGMICAGCFPFNSHSLRILEKNGFVRWPEGDMKEISVFDGSEITMLGYVCHKEA